MDIEGKNALVLGGGGLVGMAVCRLLLSHRLATLVVATRREASARRAVERLNKENADARTRITPVWGDVFLRSEWQQSGPPIRSELLLDAATRRRLISDILDPMNRDAVESSFLVQLVTGAAPGLKGEPADLIVDCMNTATVISYQNIFALAQNVAASAAAETAETNFAEDVEELLAALYIPQLVRHVQLLNEAMRRAETEAYVKVGTSGTGGMGFNIPYTHGEERPSRMLLSKAALAGAHSQLLFLMARTPGGPRIVKEIKPTALIGWREIEYGPVGDGGRGFLLYDCPIEQAVSIENDANLAPNGEFGKSTGERLNAVYIDTGENGRFSRGEFEAITALDQMRLVTPEDVAENVVSELMGANTGHDILAALDGAVTGPTYRGGLLRQAALSRLHQLEEEHGEAVAFEILGPPRLSKLLFEAELLKLVCKTMLKVTETSADALAAMLEQEVLSNASLRRHVISIGIPILLSDGKRMLRGPVVKSSDAHYGWLDLTAANMDTWRMRLTAVRETIDADLNGDTSSRHDRHFAPSRAWHRDEESFEIGEIVGWILATEDGGNRTKN